MVSGLRDSPEPRLLFAHLLLHFRCEHGASERVTITRLNIADSLGPILDAGMYYVRLSRGGVREGGWEGRGGSGSGSIVAAATGL